LKEVAGVVRDVMENAFKLDIPLSTEARWGLNWDELKPLV
jgi:DNA polymerase I-like protein with 3'-5' exonuclease and polymerase domains